MNIVAGIVLLITLLLFTIIICIANANKKEIWSCIVFEDNYDYFDEIDDDIDEYYE